MIPSTRLGSGYALPNSLVSPSKARFSGSKTAQKMPREIELEKEVQAWKKEEAIRAAKKKRRADKKARYGYVNRGLWQNFLNCHKAGYSSPLPLYRRPLAFLSVDNLKYGWQKLDKHLKKTRWPLGIHGCIYDSDRSVSGRYNIWSTAFIPHVVSKK